MGANASTPNGADDGTDVTPANATGPEDFYERGLMESIKS